MIIKPLIESTMILKCVINSLIIEVKMFILFCLFSSEIFDEICLNENVFFNSFRGKKES